MLLAFPIRIHPSATIAGLCYAGALFIGCAIEDPTSPGRALVDLGFQSAALSVFVAVVVATQCQLGVGLCRLRYSRPRALATTGLFRFVRHPSYVAFVIPLASTACMSPFAAILATSTYVLAMQFAVIAGEEASMRHQFGAEYDRYAARTPAWFGIGLAFDPLRAMVSRMARSGRPQAAGWIFSAALCVLGLLCFTLVDDVMTRSRYSSLLVTDAVSGAARDPAPIRIPRGGVADMRLRLSIDPNREAEDRQLELHDLKELPGTDF